MSETFVYTNPANTAIAASTFIIMCPMSFRDPSVNTDVWLGAGTITHLSVTVGPGVIAGGRPLLHVYDGLVEASQLPSRAGTGANTGRVSLGGAIDSSRSFSNPLTGTTILTDCSRTNAGAGIAGALTANVLAMRKRQTFQCAEQSTTAIVSQPVEFQNLDIRCGHGIVLVFENSFAAAIPALATGSGLIVSCQYEVLTRGYESWRRSTLANRAAIAL